MALLLVAPVQAAEGRPNSAEKQIEEAISDPANGEPMTLVISLNHQKIDIYRGTTLITSSEVSTGMRGYATRAGVFSILEKKRRHHSNLYSSAPMPWMQRLTWSGTALHAGVVLGYPASHGCIRLLFSFAPKLYQITTVGEHVVVAQDRITPKLIEHDNLFQSLPPRASPVIATRNQAPKPQLSNATEGYLTTSRCGEVMQVHASSAGNEDTRTHAINPPTDVSWERATGRFPHQTAAKPGGGVDITASDPVLKSPAPLSVGYKGTAAISNVLAGPVRVMPSVPDAAPSRSAPNAALSIAATELTAGTKAAALQAAEPRSNAPLRILVTRRTLRDRVMAVQFILSELGYLAPQAFDGTLGKATATAIKDFQKANGLPPTGSFTDELVKKIYESAGKNEPPIGQLFVRQEFGRLFDVPVSFDNPEKPLGTHLFTAMQFVPGETKTPWMALSLEGDDPAAALDRLEIPEGIRQRISERLTPGSSLIIGDTAIDTAALLKGADFVVWARQAPANAKKSESKAADLN